MDDSLGPWVALVSHQSVTEQEKREISCPRLIAQLQGSASKKILADNANTFPSM